MGLRGRAQGPLAASARRARQSVLERYVLGSLEEDARAVLRARVIESPDVCAEVREIELDLLDAEVRDGLDATCRRDVDVGLVHTTADRSAWTLSRALAEYGRRHDYRPQVDDAAGWCRPAAAGIWPPVSLWPTAATLVASALWLGGSFRSIPGLVPSIQQDAPAARRNAIATVRLPDAGAAASPHAVRIDASTAILRLEVALTSPAPPILDVILRDVRAGRSVWVATSAIVTLADGQATLIVDVPADRLPHGPIDVIFTAAEARRSDVRRFVLERD